MSPVPGDVFLISLEPARGREIRRTRPCVIVSPDDLNDELSTFVVAPMTTDGHPYPFRIPCQFRRKAGFVVLDQVRTVDADRLVRRLGRLSSPTLKKCLGVLREMFEE